MIQFHFADERIAGRPRFHAKRRFAAFLLYPTFQFDRPDQKIADGVARYLQGKTDRAMRAGPVTRTLENLRTALKRVV
jgi:hypothetical protein